MIRLCGFARLPLLDDPPIRMEARRKHHTHTERTQKKKQQMQKTAVGARPRQQQKMSIACRQSICTEVDCGTNSLLKILTGVQIVCSKFFEQTVCPTVRILSKLFGPQSASLHID